MGLRQNWVSIEVCCETLAKRSTVCGNHILHGSWARLLCACVKGLQASLSTLICLRVVRMGSEVLGGILRKSTTLVLLAMRLVATGHSWQTLSIPHISIEPGCNLRHAWLQRLTELESHEHVKVVNSAKEERKLQRTCLLRLRQQIRYTCIRPTKRVNWLWLEDRRTRPDTLSLESRP